MTNVHFSFRRGAGDVPEILYGKVEIKPTLAFARGTSLVLPAPTTLDLVNGEATANNVYPTPAPVEGQVEWAYRVKAIDTRGQSFEWMVGVPDSTGTVEFATLPRYFETKPPLFGEGPKGEPGEAATIQIGTTTSGSTPSVTNSGTNKNAVLNFVFPKGDKGDTGDASPESVVGAEVIGDQLTLSRLNGTTFNAGNVRGEQGIPGPPGPNTIPTDEAVAALFSTDSISAAGEAGDLRWASREATLQRLNSISRLTESPVYIYVDNVLGSDDNDGKPASKYKTIQRAFDDISNRIINQTHVVRITSNPGAPYLEDATLQGVIGAGVWVQPSGGIPTDPTMEFGLKVRALNFQDCISRILVEGIEFIDLANAHSSYTANLRSARSGYLSARMLRFPQNTLDQERKAIDFDGQIGTISECFFNAQKVIAVIQNGSSVKLYDNNVHGTTKSGTGVWVMGAVSYALGKQAWLTGNATTPYLRTQGGMVSDEVWQTFTPGFKGYGTMEIDTISVDEAKYTVIGKTCFYSFAATFNVVSAPSNIVVMKLPLPSKNGFNVPLGVSGVRDPSFMPGYNLRNGQNELWLYRADMANWTVGTGRRVHGSGSYEIA